MMKELTFVISSNAPSSKNATPKTGVMWTSKFRTQHMPVTYQSAHTLCHLSILLSIYRHLLIYRSISLSRQFIIFFWSLTWMLKAIFGSNSLTILATFWGFPKRERDSILLMEKKNPILNHLECHWNWKTPGKLMGYQLPFRRTGEFPDFWSFNCIWYIFISSWNGFPPGIPVSITSSLDHRPSSFLTVFRASRLVRNRWGLMSSPEVSHKWIWDSIRIYQKIPYILKNIVSYHTSTISNHVKGLQHLPFTNYHLWWPYKAQWNGDWLMDFASDSNLFNFGALGPLKKLNPLLKHIHIQSVITHTHNCQV